MRQRNPILRRNEPGIGGGQRIITDVVLFDPSQTVPAQDRVVVIGTSHFAATNRRRPPFAVFF